MTDSIHTYCECEQCGKTVRDSLHRCPVDVETIARLRNDLIEIAYKALEEKNP